MHHWAQVPLHPPTHLVKELFASGARLDGKLQLSIHGGDTDVDLWDMGRGECEIRGRVCEIKGA